MEEDERAMAEFDEEKDATSEGVRCVCVCVYVCVYVCVCVCAGEVRVPCI
jgi:hypothetical protein